MATSNFGLTTWNDETNDTFKNFLLLAFGDSDSNMTKIDTALKGVSLRNVNLIIPETLDTSDETKLVYSGAVNDFSGDYAIFVFIPNSINSGLTDGERTTCIRADDVDCVIYKKNGDALKENTLIASVPYIVFWDKSQHSFYINLYDDYDKADLVNGKVNPSQANAKVIDVTESITIDETMSNCCLVCGNTSEITVTVPDNMVGTEVEIVRASSGNVKINGNLYCQRASVYSSMKIQDVYGIAAIKCIASSKWIISGDVVEVA